MTKTVTLPAPVKEKLSEADRAFAALAVVTCDELHAIATAALDKMDAIARAAGFRDHKVVYEAYDRAMMTDFSAEPIRLEKPVRPIMYRNPQCESETWCGHGRPPRWIVREEAAGIPRTFFLVS